MSEEPRHWRVYKIPRDSLDLFFVKLDSQLKFSKMLNYEVEWVFLAADSKHYDVVVKYTGSYPFAENQINEFAHELRAKIGGPLEVKTPIRP